MLLKWHYWHYSRFAQLLFHQNTMASFISKLETWLKCHICQETVRQPKTLQCFHSFCEECVRQEVKTTPRGVEGVKCPVCNAFTDKREIKTNALMCELLEVHMGKYYRSLINQLILDLFHIS